jgi:hypothetical protein
MPVQYGGYIYTLGNPIPNHVPLPKEYARVNGNLQFSNYYMRLHFNVNNPWQIIIGNNPIGEELNG